MLPFVLSLSKGRLKGVARKIALFVVLETYLTHTNLPSNLPFGRYLSAWRTAILNTSERTRKECSIKDKHKDKRPLL